MTYFTQLEGEDYENHFIFVPVLLLFQLVMISLVSLLTAYLNSDLV